ncbi:unnamed protein product [Ixodes hexagonus]
MNFTLEVRPLLKVCKIRLVVREPKSEAASELHVECTASSLTATLKNRNREVQQSTELVLPTHIKFKPDTRTPLKEARIARSGDQFEQTARGASQDRELTFSIQMEDDDVSSRETFESAEDTPRMTDAVKPVAGCPYTIMCRKCKNELVPKGTVFRRVLPLPSADWKEMAAEWFCHKHDSDKELPTKLSPEPDEMFTSVSYLHLHGLLVGGVVDGRGTGDWICCAKCGSVVAKREDERVVAVLQMRVDVVSLKEGGPKLVLRTDAASLLRGLMKEQMALSMSCRIILETEETSLLLWLMETGLELFQATDLTPGRHQIQFTRATKVLFLLTETESAVVRSWKDDPLVDVQPVDTEVLSEASALLRESSEPQVAWEDFRVGFVPEALTPESSNPLRELVKALPRV